jgi:hypothetical protein
MAGERKAIQSLRPSDYTTAFGRAEGFSWRGGRGTAESRALTMRGEGGGKLGKNFRGNIQKRYFVR